MVRAARPGARDPQRIRDLTRSSTAKRPDPCARSAHLQILAPVGDAVLVGDRFEQALHAAEGEGSLTKRDSEPAGDGAVLEDPDLDGVGRRQLGGSEAQPTDTRRTRSDGRGAAPQSFVTAWDWHTPPWIRTKRAPRGWCPAAPGSASQSPGGVRRSDAGSAAAVSRARTSSRACSAFSRRQGIRACSPTSEASYGRSSDRAWNHVCSGSHRDARPQLPSRSRTRARLPTVQRRGRGIASGARAGRSGPVLFERVARSREDRLAGFAG